MPTYKWHKYSCVDCDCVFDSMELKDNPPAATACKECGKEAEYVVPEVKKLSLIHI